ELYTYESNHKNPRVSPMYATKEMLTGLPEIYIQMGQEELLGYDVNYFLSKLKQAKVPYTIDVWKEMVYLFQMADEFFKESHLAMETVGNHIKKTEPSASLSRYRDVPWN
ncbi:MAG TPA: alpha/beta hydrolase fold domain-containing protein, partial [Treponemataceae bacterium]|nr:alpha/beta hydrolase fold domain-containing protein [Treponemataceae bacterium]